MYAQLKCIKKIYDYDLHLFFTMTFVVTCPYFSECKKQCEVFLGGSCNPTTWRADTAIPALQREGISFYNPVSICFNIKFIK